MSSRGMHRLVVFCVLAGMLMAFVGFAKVVLSPMVATFIAGLGVGAMGMLAVRAALR